MGITEMEEFKTGLPEVLDPVQQLFRSGLNGWRVGGRGVENW